MSDAGISTRSMVVAGLSTVVEWYDFTLYLYFATVLSRVFFGTGEGALVTTLGTFGVAYLLRPLGAVFFGNLGDRHGRRAMMLLSMALMSAAMLATALLPTYATLGAAAGWLLVLLRCAMAFSVGGEYTGVVAYLLESAPAHRRGLITSCASAASEVGALLAVAVSAMTVHAFPEADLVAWGWRIPFFIGAALAAAVWLARSTMQESPDFERQRAAGTAPRQPLRYVLAHQRPGIARGFAISALGSITYYVGITYVPSFLSSVGALSEDRALWLSTLAALVVIIVTPFVGALSDAVGRKPVLLAIAALSAILPITLYSLMASGSWLLASTGALVLASIAGGMSAVGAVATAEQFPGEGRLTGLALGATAATAVFGGLTPFLAQLLITHTGWPGVPGLLIALVAVAVAPAFALGPETRPRRQVAPDR